MKYGMMLKSIYTTQIIRRCLYDAHKRSPSSHIYSRSSSQDTFLYHQRLNSWSWSVYKNHKRCCSSNSKKDQSDVKDAGVKTASGSAASSDDVPTTQPELRTVVKGLSFIPSFKAKPRKKTDFSLTYTENVFITPARAMYEYVLAPSDLENLPKTRRRSPYPESDDIIVFLRKDIERKAMTVWGNMENLQEEKKRLYSYRRVYNTNHISARQARKQYDDQHSHQNEEQPFLFSAEKKALKGTSQPSVFRTGPGRVVMYAIIVNGFNIIIKFGAWIYTGSHSMFAEFIHSVADTVNQGILAVGLYQSQKKADLEHPYGWANFRNVASLISGVGIFCMGAGLSIYHGIHGLIYPDSIEQVSLALGVLSLSFITEGATLLVALRQVMSEARLKQMSSFQYILQSSDPSTNVVLLEDAAAVLGVSIAGGCMGLSYYTGNPIPDAIGSLLVGGLLASVAGFIIYTNTITLVGRSIPEEKRLLLTKELENDRLIRALHDVKATDMGSNAVRFKAEVDFDGREVTRLYIDRQDLEAIYKEMQSIESTEDVENFMLKHGENVVDTLGAEVDRIEKLLKSKHPEIRHVDLEQL